MKPPLSILIIAFSWVVAASRFPNQTTSDSIFVSYCNLNITESSQPHRPFNYASIGTILSSVSPIERDLDANHFAEWICSERVYGTAAGMVLEMSCNCSSRVWLGELKECIGIVVTALRSAESGCHDR